MDNRGGKDMRNTILLIIILACALMSARSAYKASIKKPVYVSELIIIVGNGEDAQQIANVMVDFMEMGR